MDEKRLQKIENTICNIINYSTKTFLGAMAVITGGLAAFCLLQIFKDPVMSIFGLVGFAGASAFLWEAKSNL